MREPFASRCAALVSKARRSGCRAVLVTKIENVFYLSGFTGEDSWLILAARRPIILTDSRFTEEAGLTSPDWRVECRKGPITAEAARILKSIGLPTAFEAGSLSVDTHRLLARALKGRVRLTPTTGLVESLRMRKDRFEMAAIRRAISAAERGFLAALGDLKTSATESSFAAALEYHLRLAGAAQAAFPIIAACQPNSSLPHAKPGSKRICESPTLLVDWGARRGGYNSDLTRVVAWGKVTPQIGRIWRVARAAQKAALRAIRPGAPAARVDAAARKVITDAGFGRFFGHGLGHGVGLEVHEGPTLSPKSKTRLAEGMVVTVEPGIYLSGVGGVRVEDMVLVTRRGAKVLTHVSRDPRSLARLAVRQGR